MANHPDADARIKLTIGTQFVDIQLLQDRVADLTSQVAERDAIIAEFVKGQAAASPAPATPAA